MKVWSGPSGRSLNVLSVGLITFFLIPIIIHPFFPYATNMTLPIFLILLALMVVALALLRQVHKDDLNMVFRMTPVSVENAGTAILRSLDEAMTYHGPPVSRPQPTGLKTWFEWEVDIPYQELRIGVRTGGLQGRVVGLGPVNEENDDEIERLKMLVDRALD